MKRGVAVLLGLLAVGLFGVLAQLLSSPGDGGSLVDVTGRVFEPAPPGLLATGAGLGVLLLGGWLLGRGAQLIGLSKITGYLAFGLIASPKVGALFVGDGGVWVLSAGQLENLVLVNDLAVALIALMAGGEIRFNEMRERARSITWVLIGGSSAVLVCVTVLMFFLLRGEGGISPPGGMLGALSVAAVVGVIATANSPAVVIAMIGETGANGPMAKTSLAVTVCKDLMLVVLFATALALAVGAVGAGGDGAGSSSGDGGGVVWRVVWQLGGSLLGGVVVGWCLAFYVSRVRAHVPVVLVLGSFFVALLSEMLGLKVLIVGLTAGLTLTNFFPVLSEGLFERVEEVIVGVFVVFFGVAGTKVDPEALEAVWGVVLALVGVRMLSVWAGTAVGCRAGRVGGGAGRWMWTAFVSQAGVSLALVIVLTETFEGQAFAGPLRAALISAIALNELVGPVLFKVGLVRSGEVGGVDVGGDDGGDAAGGGGGVGGGAG